MSNILHYCLNQVIDIEPAHPVHAQARHHGTVMLSGGIAPGGSGLGKEGGRRFGEEEAR